MYIIGNLVIPCKGKLNFNGNNGPKSVNSVNNFSHKEQLSDQDWGTQQKWNQWEVDGE
jgi:hypothetical protein